jgi:NAD+ kinase
MMADKIMNIGLLAKAYKNVLVVVKQTPYEFYSQLKLQGNAPVALRWERLKNRYMKHKGCVDEVCSILDNIGVKYTRIGREELHRGSILGRDLIIAVGGDGTILNTQSFLDDEVPVLGVNSDPTSLTENTELKKVDERRSRGALAGTSSHTLHEDLPRILMGDVQYRTRSRIRCLVRSAYTETRLPPALNDILVTSPSPADVSRFRLAKCKGNSIPSYSPIYAPDETYALNVWSSGIWLSTATGSTAAMNSAGAFPKEP